MFCNMEKLVFYEKCKLNENILREENAIKCAIKSKFNNLTFKNPENSVNKGTDKKIQ